LSEKNNKILICYNEPFVAYDNYSGKYAGHQDAIDLSESEFFTHLNIIESILKKNFEDVRHLPIGTDFYENIKNIESFNPDIIFNFVESIEGRSEYEVYVAGLFEILEISYTGNNGLTLANCLNKFRSKQILTSYSINTPSFTILKLRDDIESTVNDLDFPLILKLNKEDASIGISENSVVHNYEELITRINFLRETYNQDLIIEEYIEGREFNVAILDEEILPISEINFSGLPDNLPKIVTYEAKWSPGTIYYKYTTPECPAKISPEIKKILEETAWSAYSAMECRDYARVDIRLDKNNIPYVIEVNPNPDISEDSGFVRAVKAAGKSYESLILQLAQLAIDRIYYYDTETEEDGQTAS